MKKIIASAVGLMLVGGIAATSAVAVESQFGGYWRTRFTYDNNMAGTAATGVLAPATNNSGSNYVTDTRTRLYYTAKFSDDLKFVNKFEFNNTWGDAVGGDIGADGMGIFRIKNSYADFNLGNTNVKVGIQGGTISRGFMFADDFSGIHVTPKFGDVSLHLLYIAVVDEEVRALLPPGGEANMFSVMPSFKIGDAVTLTPQVTYYKISQANIDNNIWYFGGDVDVKLDAASIWGTFLYNAGEFGNNDISAFLIAAGAEAGIVHGQAFYATGDDGTDPDVENFISPPGSSYYWSEIMGLGIFDNNDSVASPDDNITNVWALNAGVTLKPMDKLKLSFDVWYAELAEDDAAGNTDLGLEFDAVASYKIMDNLNADFVFAYLVAGDATGDDDVIESGLRLSLSF